MKYRITEHKDGNDKKYYTVELLQKGIFWGESWQTVGEHPNPRIRVVTKFNSIAAAQEYIKAQHWTESVVEEGEV
jgi:hypothetical protein